MGLHCSGFVWIQRMRKNNLFPKPKWRFQKSAVFPDPEEIFKRFVKLVINCWFSREKNEKEMTRKVLEYQSWKTTQRKQTRALEQK